LSAPLGCVSLEATILQQKEKLQLQLLFSIFFEDSIDCNLLRPLTTGIATPL
jgi:hypothetical protein